MPRTFSYFGVSGRIKTSKNGALQQIYL